MTINTQSDYDLHNLRTIEDVKIALTKLSGELTAEGLERVVNFNHTYLIITRRVHEQFKKETFDYPKFLEEFDTVFAHYYFDALKNYISNKQAPSSWHIAFTASSNKQVSNFIAMALGVNAHVNNDIPQVLFECNAQNKHYSDFNTINVIIAASINEVINNLKNDTNPLGPKNYFLTPLYKLLIRILISRWRYKAWKNFRHLQAKTKTVSDIEKSAATIARMLIRLPL